MKDKIIEILKDKGLLIDENEFESLGEAIQEIFEAKAEQLEKEEPYATISIARLREAGRDIYDILAFNE